MTITHNSHPYATSNSVSYNQQISSSPIAFHADILSPAGASMASMAAGGTALSSPTTMSSARKKSQPKSKNHGRFPCSIPGCFAVANHLSSMCRHKWGHLPQRLLPACRGHLPNGGPCPVRYQGRADTMKRHWLTHHTNEGPWVPDRYPPFEDLWKLVREGEVVLTPPSKYAYDSPPEQIRPLSAASASGSTTTNEQSNGHIPSLTMTHDHSSPSPSNARGPFLNPGNSGVPNRPSSASFSFGPGGRPNSFAGSSTLSARDAASTQRRNSFADGMSPVHTLPVRSSHTLHTGQTRISRGNLRPWKVSEPSVIISNEYEEEYDELESDRNSVGADDGHEGLDNPDFQVRGYGDVEMIDAMDDDGTTMEELSDQGGSPSHYSSARSHRSNSNPRSPVSLHILHEHDEIAGTGVREHGHGNDHDQAHSDSHVQIHVPQVVLPPLTPLTQHERLSSNMYPFRPRYPLVSNYNYNGTVMPTSNLRGTPTPTAEIPSLITVLTRPQDDNDFAESRVGQENIPVGTGYVYGAKKGSPPGPGFTPASIPHSELSLLSHPPTDRILPSVNTTSANGNSNGWNGSSGLMQPHATVPTVASY